MWCRKCALQYKEQGEKKYQFKNGGIRQWGKQNKNEDQQNDGLKHLERWQLKEKWEWREEWWALEEEKCGGGGGMWHSCFYQLTESGSSACLSSCLGTSRRSMKLCSSFLKAFICALIRYSSSCSLILRKNKFGLSKSGKFGGDYDSVVITQNCDSFFHVTITCHLPHPHPT